MDEHGHQHCDDRGGDPPAGVAWLYVWFFRAVPRVVLLILFGNLGVLYARYEVGLPFDRQIGK